MIIKKKIVNKEKKYSSLTLTKYRSIEIDEPNIFNGLTFINLSHCKLEILESGTFANLNSLETLFLNNNELKKIEPDCFTGCNGLTYINLSHCKLEILESGTFANLNSLVNLFLNNNELKKIEPDCFTGCNGLTYINLSHCKLEILESGTFANLNSLETLFLNNNELKKIEADCFTGCNGLTYINLSHCKLEILESGTFANLNSLETLFLNNNNLIYFNNNLQHHCNINLNGNFLNNENHPLLTPLRNHLGNIEQNLSHYEYFKTIINESNFNDLINYLANIHKDLFSKNIFIIFYIITHYLLNIDIFTSELEIKVIINKFLDNYIDSYTKKFIKHLKITNQQNTNIQIKNYFSSKFNSYIIEEEFNMVLLRMLKSLLNVYINTDFKNTFIKKISIIKNYIMTKNVSQNYKKDSNIMTKNISQNYKKNYNIIMNSNSISKKIGNRVELNMLIKSINEKFKLPNNIN